MPMPVLLERWVVRLRQKLWGVDKAVLSPKFMCITDAPGNPLDFVLAGGQAGDIGQAENSLALTTESANALLDDKSYDSDFFIQALNEKGMKPIISPRSNRMSPQVCDWFAYKKRHLIKRFFNKIKHYRRKFSRYEEMARIYMFRLSIDLASLKRQQNLTVITVFLSTVSVDNFVGNM